MPAHHAFVSLDHHSASIVPLGSGNAHGSKVNEQLHLHNPHENNERVRHAFFGKVCDGLQDIAQVLVVGGHTSLADFRHYVDKHRPHTAAQLVGYLVVDHPSEAELQAAARAWFAHHEHMAGIAV